MELQSAVYHVPALLEECIDGLNIQPGGTYVDVTFGGGGHSRAICAQLPFHKTLYRQYGTCFFEWYFLRITLFGQKSQTKIKSVCLIYSNSDD